MCCVTRALVLGRRRKGRPIEAGVAETASRLEAAGWTVISSVVDGKGDLRRETKRAVKAGVDVVVAVGGDGAVLQVIQKVAAKKPGKPIGGGPAAADTQSGEPDAAGAKGEEPISGASTPADAKSDDPSIGNSNSGDVKAADVKVADPKGGDHTVALGIVPMGTGNLLAGNLGIPKGIDKAVEVILGQRRRVIDVGEAVVGGKKRLFAVACGVGFDAEVMDATAKSRKRRFGKLAYFASALGRGRKMRNGPHEISIDGVPANGLAAQVFVANFGGMGLGMEPRLEVKPDDGLLDVIIVRAGGPVEGLLAGWEAIRQRRHGHTRSGRVFRSHAREVTIATKGSRRLVETDGSVVGKTPIKVSIRPLALTVIVPPEG
jgi:diacylglycerol kinase family enzyme